MEMQTATGLGKKTSWDIFFQVIFSGDFGGKAPYAGYTPQDNRADFGTISPLLIILGNVPIILVDLKRLSYQIFLWCEVC